MVELPSQLPDLGHAKLITAKTVHSRSRSQRPKQPFVFWENSLTPTRKPRRPLKRTSHVLATEPDFTPEFRTAAEPVARSRYTVKYIGVTDGQIGILSTKRPIPKMSYVEACPRTPLPMIYASVSRKLLPTGESNQNLLKEELSFIETHARDKIRERRGSPKSWGAQEYAVHRYSIPRGLVAVRKQREDSPEKVAECIRNISPEYRDFALRFENEKQKRFPTPRMRRGMSGWMLSGYRLEEQPMLQKMVKRRAQEKSRLDSSEITGDLYLKYLKLKYSLQQESVKARSHSQT